MSDLIDDLNDQRNSREFTVSEISAAVKKLIEGEFEHIRIRGELGRVTIARSGHAYLDLKDDRAVLSSVIWKGNMSRLSLRPEEGMEVIATGRMTTFAGQSRYQFVIDDLTLAGEGALMALLQKRMKALEAEGLFSAERKKALPYLPEIIGVVTSPTGAVIRDILHRVQDRFPRKVLLWPVLVQGDKAAGQIANAIRGFNRLEKGGRIPRPDVLIVARGGGSIEDLWAFNEEIVARAVADSEIPVISAVGHETDTTLVDYVSDRRAPTPTAAAEMAVPVRADLLAMISRFEERRHSALSRRLTLSRQRFQDRIRLLPKPQSLISEREQMLDHRSERLRAGLKSVAVQKRVKLAGLQRSISPFTLSQKIKLGKAQLTQRSEGLLTAIRRYQKDLNVKLQNLERMRVGLGPNETLSRGYTIVRTVEGQVISSKASAELLNEVEVQFVDGRLPVKPNTSKPTQKTLFD